MMQIGLVTGSAVRAAWLGSLLLLAACVLALARAAGAQEPAVPALQAHVTDLTGTLSTDEISRLEQKLSAFEARKGSQVALLMVKTTQPESIEQYSMRVAEKWRGGRKGVDDGALLIVAKDDRALRIEVGYGLEGVLSDIVSNRIIQQIIVPRFKAGDFYGGVDAGLDAIVKVIDGEPLPAPAPRAAPRNIGGNWEGLLPVALIIVFVAGGILRAMFGRLPGSTLTGFIVSIIAWLLVGAMFAAVLAGVIAFVFSLFVGLPGSGRGGFRPGGWGGGGFGGGGGWSGGSSGGCGGGGGGFGGGGASGRW